MRHAEGRDELETPHPSSELVSDYGRTQSPDVETTKQVLLGGKRDLALPILATSYLQELATGNMHDQISTTLDGPRNRRAGALV